MHKRLPTDVLPTPESGGKKTSERWQLMAVRCFPIFRRVVQLDLSAGALLRRVDHAGINGPRIDMQAYSSVVELARIKHAMDGFPGIDPARMLKIHLHYFGRLQLASAVW